MISAEKKNKIKRQTGIGLGILIVILAVVMILQVILLFSDGMAGKFGVRDDGTNVIYTREIVRERLLTSPFVCVPAVLTGLMLIAAAGTRILWPSKEEPSVNVRFRGVRLSAKAVRVLQLILLLSAFGLIVAGILNGGAEDVLIKAINLCTECLGLG